MINKKAGSTYYTGIALHVYMHDGNICYDDTIRGHEIPREI